MKRMNFICFFACLILLVSCRKHGPGFPGGGNEKLYTLKRIVHGTQDYNFYFNKRHELDSVVSYMMKEKDLYQVLRSGGRIDTVKFFRNGVLSWFNTDIEYDNAGNIIAFNYIPGTPPAEPVTITYEQGHVHAITRINPYLSFLSNYDTLFYNEQNDITRWSTVLPRSTFLDVKRFTYDDGLNPLYYIDDLLVVFNRDSFLWQFFLSEHNSTTKYYELWDATVNYENSYDSKNRIVKKRFTERNFQEPDSLMYEYQR